MYVLRRFLVAIPTLLAVSVLAFWFVDMIPGDPAAKLAGNMATNEEVAAIRSHLGLDQSPVARYALFLKGIVDPEIAVSYRTSRPVVQEIGERLPKTLIVAVGGLLLGILFGVVTGVICALRQGGWFDAIVTIVTLAGISMPIYWLGLLCIWLFAVELRWLPAAGAATPWHFVLPVIVVATRPAALFSRLVTANLLEVMGKDYLDTARSKGLSETRVIVRHALRNSLVAAVSVAGVQFGGMLGGSVVTETVFGIPGLGRLLVEAVGSSDYPVIQYCVLMFAAVFIVINLATDLIGQWLDPRTREKSAATGYGRI
ncbi:ABC transporter permease [Sinirhodobacter populi]|uniref:ABC transporter permease n=1 Tax=Paenirhodobacter populi TaxID=2306993 RepID=A0A443K2X5_9RHOB|nr:ABC transporter permease [Sinirhodobacter populi]RWR27117.1 ABC transporter permease [Sinirhodobacter populi]